VNIIDTLKSEFIPYAGEILLNNLPNVADGLLPVQRKVLWALHKNKISSDKPYIKLLRASAFSMVYYVFGDLPLASAMKNMANNGINYLYLDPKGSFGDKRKKEGVGASPRYIECRLSKYSEDMLNGIDKSIIPMKRNFDDTEDEPVMLPSIIPNTLINSSQSIAVGEASKMYSHNLEETCLSIISYIQNNNIDEAISIIKCPDFSIGGKIIYDKNTFYKIYTTGLGSFTVIGNYVYDEKENKVFITEVPQGTYIEDIEEKFRKAYEKGLFKEVIDIHDSSGMQGIQLDIYLKKNTDINLFISKLRKYTPFESSLSFNCQMIDLDCKTPVLMSLQMIYDRWIEHRINCIKNEFEFDINKNKKQLHLLKGLHNILLDLDKAISLIRLSKNDQEAIEKLKENFPIDDVQADYISQIRLININKDYIIKRIKNIDDIEKELTRLEDIRSDDNKIKNVIIEQLQDVIKKHSRERKTKIIYKNDNIVEEEIIDDYNCKIFFTKEGYLKKVPLTSLRGVNLQKLKEGDAVTQELDTSNKADLILFSSKQIAYKLKINEINDSKTSLLGDYINNIIDLDKDEKIIYMISTTNYSGYLLIAFKNGKIAKINLSSYATKTNRNKLINAYSTDCEIVNMLHLEKDIDLLCKSSINKVLIINTEQIAVKSSKISVGVSVLKSKKDSFMGMCVPMDIVSVEGLGGLEGAEYYKGNVNSIGNYLKKGDEIRLYKYKNNFIENKLFNVV